MCVDKPWSPVVAFGFTHGVSRLFVGALPAGEGGFELFFGPLAPTPSSAGR